MASLFKRTGGEGGGEAAKKKGRIHFCNEGKHVLNLKLLFLRNAASMFHTCKPV